jgi:hypothetical protein
MDKWDRFLHNANLERFRKQLANTADDAQRRTLLELLDAEEAKDKPPNADGRGDMAGPAAGLVQVKNDPRRILA